MALGARLGCKSACERRVWHGNGACEWRVWHGNGACGGREWRVWHAGGELVRRAGANMVAGMMRALRTLKHSIKKWRVKWRA